MKPPEVLLLPVLMFADYFLTILSAARKEKTTSTSRWGFELRCRSPNPPKSAENNEVDSAKVIEWLDRMKPSLNVQASSSDEFGVVMYPK